MQHFIYFRITICLVLLLGAGKIKWKHDPLPFLQEANVLIYLILKWPPCCFLKILKTGNQIDGHSYILNSMLYNDKFNLTIQVDRLLTETCRQ